MESETEPADRGRIGAVVVALNGKIYVGGGVMENDTYLSDWNEFDPVMNKWSSRQPACEKRNAELHLLWIIKDMLDLERMHQELFKVTYGNMIQYQVTGLLKVILQGEEGQVQ
jgi:hypothetical protein